MTTPVITASSAKSSENIAMTTPVITSTDDKMMTMSFVLPARYTLDTIPTPDDNRVKLVEVPSYQVAVHQFSRYANDAKIARLTQQLQTSLKRDGLAST